MNGYLDSNTWNVIYIVTGLIAAALTIGLYFWDLLGLNIFGLCSITFIRMPDNSFIPLAAILVMVVLFLFVGLFTIRYFKKHMPNTIGLRRKKYKENKTLSYYFVGYLTFLIITLTINIVELFSCR
jgi:hypothetical protein